MATKKKVPAAVPEQLDLFGYDIKTVVGNILGMEEYKGVVEELFQSEITSSGSAWESEDARAFKLHLQNEGIILSHVDQYGGEEMGKEYWSVYSFAKDSNVVYVKFEGWYASYNGSEFEEWYFVKPVPKQVIVFEKE